VPHYGSSTGMSDYFLSQINPSIAIISVGVNNKYGYPSQIARELLKKYRIKYLRTDRDGEVEIIFDGQAFQVSN